MIDMIIDRIDQPVEDGQWAVAVRRECADRCGGTSFGVAPQLGADSWPGASLSGNALAPVQASRTAVSACHACLAGAVACCVLAAAGRGSSSALNSKCTPLGKLLRRFRSCAAVGRPRLSGGGGGRGLVSGAVPSPCAQTPGERAFLEGCQEGCSQCVRRDGA